jgi:hypothetical protein
MITDGKPRAIARRVVGFGLCAYNERQFKWLPQRYRIPDG